MWKQYTASIFRVEEKQSQIEVETKFLIYTTSCPTLNTERQYVPQKFR
jgi:hypothetical protein